MAPRITDAGPVADSLETAVTELNAAFLTEFGTGLNLSANSYTGRQNPIIAARDVSVQQFAVEIASLFNLNDAQGRFLDFIGTLLNEPRLPATSATVAARLYGVPGFNVGDRRVRYLRNNTFWRSPIGTLIGANGTVDAVLTSDVAGTATPAGIAVEAWQDGTDQWSIVDTSPSFTAVESLADYVEGRDTEGDPPYRSRLRVAGRGSGSGTAPGALRALQRVAGAGAAIDNNRSLAPNANGVPGKSIEALVEEGTDDEVAQAILDGYSDTAGFFGSSSGTAYDPNGNAVTVAFTRIARIDVIWDVSIDTTGAETDLPDDAESIVQTALANYTNGLASRLDVQPEEGKAAVRTALPKGSIPATGLTVLVALDGSVPAASPIVITSRQRARTNPEPQSAEIVGITTGPFNIVSAQVLQLAVDGGTAVDVTFTVADFQIISAASALEIATAINNRTNGIVAGSEQGALVLRSATTGATSSIQIGAGSTIGLLSTLGMSVSIVNGLDSDITVTIV